MNVKIKFFSAYSAPGGGWFRLFGVGLGWKDTRRIPLSFSERNGYKRHLMLGVWSLAVLTPERPAEKPSEPARRLRLAWWR